MSKVTILAFCAETLQGTFQQLGFILQKLAHRKVESRQSRNQVTVVEDEVEDDDF